MAEPDEHPLFSMAAAICARAEGALLDARLDSLPELISDDVREMLLSVYEAGEADSLRDFLARPALSGWLEQTATQRDESALQAQLSAWLGNCGGGPDDPARLVQIAPPPSDLEALLTWARPYELLGELTRPAREVIAELSDLGDVSLAGCLVGHAASEPRKGTRLLSQPDVRALAQAYVTRQAASYASHAARALLWTRPTSSVLVRLAERLRALVGDVAFPTLQTIIFLPARPVRIDMDSGVVHGHVRAGVDGKIVELKAFLSGFEQRAITVACEACRASHCLHRRALAARLLDACHDAADALHAALYEFVRVPSWQRFLREARGAGETRRAENERLVFRLRIEGERASVGMHLQRMNANGQWTQGRLATPAQVARSSIADPRDRSALEAITNLHRTLAARFVVADLALLRALVDHPLVFIDGSGEPIRISEQTLEVTMLEQPEGLLPKVTLAGESVPYGSRRPEVSYLMRQVDAHSLVIAALTSSVRRLLSALDHFRGVLPPESYPAVAPWLASLQGAARVAMPKSLVGHERPPPRKLLLRITPGIDEGVDVALMARALTLSALWLPGQGPELIYGFEEQTSAYVRRDLNWERETAQHVTDALELTKFVRLDPFAYRIETRQEALTLLSRAARLADLLQIEWSERSRKLSVNGSVVAADLKVALFKKGQWLSVEGKVTVPGAELSVERLLEAVVRGERFVAVKGDDYVEIEHELFERLAMAQLCMASARMQLSTAALPLWLKALGEQSTAGDEAAQALLDRVRDKPVTPNALEDSFAPHLRDYQREGVAWLLERSAWAPGVCLADEMGLGKTVQAAALLSVRGRLGPALVVTPTSLTRQWVDALERFAPSLQPAAYLGDARRDLLENLGESRVLVVSYETLLRDREHFAKLAFATQVIDEAQVVRNARTQRAQAVAQVDAAFRVALSGTPIENRLGDLWSLFQLLAPGLLGPWSQFRARFAVPIERYDNRERAEALRALVHPFLLRRTKNEVASELPSRTEVIHRIELSQAERDLYDAAERTARKALGKRSRDQAARSIQILAELTKLRLLSCHPRLVVGDERVGSSKLAAFMQLSEDILRRGHRLLVFSQFTRHLGLVREALHEAGIATLYLDGSTKASERPLLVERFQNGEAPVFLISLKAGGTGLNLTAADYVVHLDPWWNPAAEDQASDRAHRIGQLKPLTIVKLVSEGTIEERVLALHDHKRRLAQAVLTGTDVPIALDASDLEALLAG
jgi:SNF2 family DNA or RNA helicase